jgi:uncharacterized protein YgiM (DUF1202 family)
MKKNGWMILSVAMLATALLARADGQLEPEKSAPKPAAKAPASKPATAAEKPVFLSPGAATITGKNVNVRGKAGYKGEVVSKLQNGDAVTVIEQVILPKPKAGEPAQWAKIVYPPSAHIWVHSSYLNPDKTVKPKKLNIRTGAGENYSVVGSIEQGTPVKEISTKGNWTEIEAPASAFAFVAANFVQQTGAPEVPSVVSIAPPEPADATTVDGGPLVVANPTDVANPNPAMEPTPEPTPDAANAAVPPPVVEEVWVPRTVSHEGVVKPTLSIQAPTKFGLHSKENGKLINYLYSPTAALEMSRYVGRHIIVSGQEGLDERWVNTPVLTIQKIYVVQ